MYYDTKLTNSLKNEVKSRLFASTGKKYNPVKVLGNGATSVAILVEDENHNQLVFKCDKKLESVFARIKSRIADAKKVKNSTAQGKLDYLKDRIELKNETIDELQEFCRANHVPVFIPKSKIFPHFTIEEFAGSTATPELLTGDKSDKLAKDLAKFYCVLHSRTQEKPSNVPLYLKVGENYSTILNRYDNLLPDDLKQLVNQSVNALKKFGNADEIQTTIHGDLRLLNLCYNENTNQLGVIDWEKASKNNIYSEFVVPALSNQKIPFSFIEQVVDEYNTHSPHQINKEKLKHLYILGIFDEYGKHSITANVDPAEFYEYYLPKMKEQIHKINQSFNITQSENE